jgi:ribosomal-protein-alanine N-acetyltransferase
MIKTKEFILRHIRMSDSKPYFESMQDKKTKKYFMKVPKNIKEARKEVKKLIKESNKKNPVMETFVLEIGGEYAGFIKIDYENYNPKEHRGRIHYATHPKFRGKGLTSKAVKLITDYGFKKFKFKRIIGRCRISNKASARVLEKAGYKLEGILKKNTLIDGKYVNDMIWAKVK